MTQVTIYVDGSYTTNNPDVTGWGWVAVVDGKEVAVDNGKLTGDIVSMRQIGGEIKAAMEAVRWATTKSPNRTMNKYDSMIFDKVIIRYDYDGVAEWAKGNWKAKKKWTKEYAAWMLKHNSNRIEFVKVNAGDNPADEYARKITGAPSAH